MSDDPARDMAKIAGWKKELTYKFINVDPISMKITVDEVDFYIKDMMCTCKSTDFLWLVPQRAGVFLACMYCNTVTGPITRDVGIGRKRYDVTPEEAVKILIEQGAQMRDRDVQAILRRFKGPAKKLAERPRPKG